MTEETLVHHSEDILKHAAAMYVQGEAVDGFAFLPRPLPKDEDGSSVNRLALLSEDDDEAVAKVRKIFRLQVKKSHRFAQINIGVLAECFNEAGGFVMTVHSDPLPATDAFVEDVSHALLLGLPRPGILDNYISDLISDKIAKVYPALV